MNEDKREIKFRFWNGKNMELQDSFYELQRANKNEKELQNIIIMQYTGLKDKDGKEIYENDILFCEDEYNGEEYYLLVVYKEDSGAFMVRSENNIPGQEIYRYDYFCDVNLQEVEVIGNQFENEDLI